MVGFTTVVFNRTETQEHENERVKEIQTASIYLIGLFFNYKKELNMILNNVAKTTQSKETLSLKKKLLVSHNKATLT